MLNPHLGQPDLHWQRSRKITRENAKRFAKKWENPDLQPKKTSKSIKLSGDKHFSEGFTIAVGIGNIENVYGIENEHIRIAIFAQLIEEEALLQLRVYKNKKLVEILNVRDDVNFNVTFELKRDTEFQWWVSQERSRKRSSSFIDLFITVLDLSFLDALATLANILEMEFASLYQLSSEDSTTEKQIIGRVRNEVPSLIHIKTGQAESAVFERKALVETRGNASQVVSATAAYAQNNNLFCIPATVSDGVLSIGRYKVTSYFLNQAQLNAHPSARVFFCQDMRTALALQHILSETRSYNPAEIIVTAHLGEDLSVVPWSYLYGHDVVFVCAPTKMCMAKVKEYDAQVRGGGAKSFKVHLGFLLHSPAGCDLQDEVVGITEAEGVLLRLSKMLNEEIQPFVLLRRITKDAVPYSEFKAWGQKHGIFKANKGMVSEVASADKSLALPAPNPAITPAPANKLSDVTLYHTMRPRSYTMLLGAKGAGKTQLAHSLCGALLKGNVQWPLFSGQIMNAGNVAYVDAETPYDEYDVNLKQYGLASELGRSFFGLSKFAPDLPAFCNTFNLASENFREGLLSYLLQHQCRFVFLDNLAALMGDMVDHGKSAQSVIDWVEKLQKAGLCVVLVHHKAGYTVASPNTDKARGSQFFTLRARTIIALVSKTEILDSRLGTEAVQAQARRDGLTVGLRFTASKTAPVLENKTLWLHLPLGSAQWDFLTLTGVDGKELELVPNELETQSSDAAYTVLKADSVTGGVTHCSDISPNCTVEETKVYEFISENSKAQNSDVQKLLGCKATKAGGILNKLVTKKLIKKEESGPTTRYSLMYM